MSTNKNFQERQEIAELHSKKSSKIADFNFIALSLLNCNGSNKCELITDYFRKGNAEEFLKQVQEAVEYFDYQNWMAALKEEDSGIVYADNYNNKLKKFSTGFGE